MTGSTSMEIFDPFSGRLDRGVNLIEASAGTGKTYTIAMLILRFVVERNFTIEQLLVVTFTRSATEELRVRIRSRLREALNLALNLHNAETTDRQLLSWLEQLEIPSEEIARRLRTAILDTDRASVFTIHGLCQRLLSEFPLDGQQQFEQELIADTSSIMQNIMDDLWRREFYQRPKQEVALLRWRYRTPEELYSSLRGVDWRQQIYPEADGLQPALDSLLAITSRLQSEWQRQRDGLYRQMAEMVAEGQFIKKYADAFEGAWRELDQFCSGNGSEVPKAEVLQMLSLEILQSPRGLKKNQYEKAETIHFELLDQYVEQLEHLQLQLRLSALAWIASEYETRMEQASLLSFDSLIERMGALLDGEQSESLRQVIQAKYEVALIDEFQDTDQTQWSIFSNLFGSGQHFLYLIGDPKQAIYKFRGADIFSYFAAQQQAHHTYTLNENWRSMPQLVESVNTIFSGQEMPFRFPQLEFHSVQPAKKIENGHLLSANGALPPMALWQLPVSEQKNTFWTAGKADEQIRSEVVAEIINLLSDPSNQFVEDSKTRNIVPGDIAILVRTHKQAAEYQAALATVGVPSVQSGSGNIFASAEAVALLQLLYAVANPGELNQLKQLLLLPWCGLDGQAIYTTINNDQQLSDWFEHLHQHHQLWLDAGVMAMVGHFVDELLIEHIAQMENAERVLTNINHLAELLQQQADDESLGIHKTVAWLQGEVDEGSAVSEGALSEQQLRLERDDEALQIITMHSSKGLEFPIVFAPFLWQRLNFVEKEKNRISCHESGALVTDIGSTEFEQRRALAIEEELAEELRILYVALTRAKYRCYLTWADVRSTAMPNRSALAYLLFSEGGDGWIDSLREVDYEQQQQRLTALASDHATQFAYRELTDPTRPVAHSYRASAEPSHDLSARQIIRRVSRRWQMSSYSSLTNLSLSASDAMQSASSVAGEHHQHPEVPVDKVQEGTVDILVEVSEDELPRGAHFGNVVHELLELIPFAEIAGGDVDSELRQRLCQRYGLELDEPAQLDQLLQRVVTTPLVSEDSELTLANISPSSTLAEMPFYLSMERINTSEINRLLAADATVSRLHEIDLEGYLTGFIDLIFEHQGQYYLLDYKSNYLDNYSTQQLESAMHHHNYGLQYWIYSVVLHRYLKRRITNYSYQKHFGRVLYLFVRGMQPQQPASGVYATKPDEQILMALDRALAGKGSGEG